MTAAEYTPKHRADVPVREYPTVQPVPRHVGSYIPEDRSHERLGAEAFDLMGLFYDMTVGNPFHRQVGVSR